MTDEELIDIIEAAHAEGSLEDEESNLVKKAILFEDKKVKDIMIGLEHVKMLNSSESILKTVEQIKESGYSRMPVYSENRQEITGILPTALYIKNFLVDEDTSMEKSLHEPIISSEDTLINDLLMEMSSKKFHMAIVHDKNNKAIGIVTLEDILEELVGEIWDENDVGDRKVRRYVSERKQELVLEVVS
jgi:CBS domain containing-hemolysin-like protein